MIKLNIGAGTHHPDGWINVDACDPTADLAIDFVTDCLPFDNGSVDAIFCSHVLEHLWWSDVPRGLAELRRVLRPGARMLVIGPDVFKTVALWREGLAPWWLVLSNLEHDQSSDCSEVYPSIPHGGHTVDTNTPENGYRHRWNCYQDRLVFALESAGFTTTLLNLAQVGNSWPVISREEWQCAVMAVK